MRNIALFCDVPNLYHCVGKRFEGRKLNYLKFLEANQGDNIIYSAVAYGYKINDATQKFITCLKHYGYEPRYRKPRKDDKIGWSVRISCDVFRILSKIDTVVLGSSDPNLTPLIQFLRERGIEVIVHACGISRTIREVASQWKEITADMLEVEADAQ